MLIRAATALCAVFLAVMPAAAHGPTRQKVVETITIAKPLADVWTRIGNFQDMSWHPAFAKTEGSGENAPDAKRTLTLVNGGTVSEVLTKHDAAGMSYSYRIVENDVKVFPVANYSSTISVKPGEGNVSVVTWQGAFYRGYPNNDPPPELSDAAAAAAVTDLYRAGLEALKKAFDAAP